MVKKPVKAKLKNIGKYPGMSDYSGVLLEQISDNLKVIAEGHMILERKIDLLDEKVDSMGTELNGRIDGLESRMGGLESRMDGLESRMGGLESRMGGLELDMRDSFKTVIDYLSTIEKDVADIKAKLDDKFDKKDAVIMERRISKIELELENCKRLIAVKKS